MSTNYEPFSGYGIKVSENNLIDQKYLLKIKGYHQTSFDDFIRSFSQMINCNYASGTEIETGEEEYYLFVKGETPERLIDNRSHFIEKYNEFFQPSITINDLKFINGCFIY